VRRFYVACEQLVNQNIQGRLPHQPVLELPILSGLWASVWTQVRQKFHNQST